jgi:hypothetical protein
LLFEPFETLNSPHPSAHQLSRLQLPRVLAARPVRIDGAAKLVPCDPLHRDHVRDDHPSLISHRRRKPFFYRFPIGRKQLTISGAHVFLTMALPAKRDQISFTIRAATSTTVGVMDFQLYATAAQLASPSISLEYLAT